MKKNVAGNQRLKTPGYFLQLKIGDESKMKPSNKGPPKEADFQCYLN
jgi:hypothetical protein